MNGRHNREIGINISSLHPSTYEVSRIIRVKIMDYEKRQKIFGTYDISGMDDAKLEFPYITAGNYSVRIAHDRNGNGVIDTGSIKERRQPEKVVIYTLSSGKDIIIIGEGMDIEQSIDLKSLFQ